MLSSREIHCYHRITAMAGQKKDVTLCLVTAKQKTRCVEDFMNFLLDHDVIFHVNKVEGFFRFENNSHIYIKSAKDQSYSGFSHESIVMEDVNFVTRKVNEYGLTEAEELLNSHWVLQALALANKMNKSEGRMDKASGYQGHANKILEYLKDKGNVTT